MKHGTLSSWNYSSKMLQNIHLVLLNLREVVFQVESQEYKLVNHWFTGLSDDLWHVTAFPPLMPDGALAAGIHNYFFARLAPSGKCASWCIHHSWVCLWSRLHSLEINVELLFYSAWLTGHLAFLCGFGRGAGSADAACSATRLSSSAVAFAFTSHLIFNVSGFESRWWYPLLSC